MTLLDGTLIIAAFALYFGLIGELYMLTVYEGHERCHELEKDCDFRSCEQMRESGWSEGEIQEFMSFHNGYYDKDYN